jgi:plasmid stability protein
MKNVTITLDEEVARWARIRAAEEDTSLSRLVGELLREKMLDESNYQTPMQNYLARSPRVLKKKGDRYPDREVLHDRQGLR